MGRLRARQALGDAGFSLVELLIVITILPMIMGGIAAAFIISIDSTKTASNKLSDSTDAQLTAAYFVRDAQGAGYITTDAVGYAPGFTASGAPITFLELAPQICGPSSVMNAHGTIPAGYQLLVAMYHEPVSGGSALSAAYWLVGSGSPYQIVRYSCTVTLSNNNTDSQTTNPVAVPIADNVNPPAPMSSYLAAIKPGPFQTAAASAWAATASRANVVGVSPSAICSGSASGTCTLTVAPSTAEFAGTVVEQVTRLGSHPISCSVATSTTFTCQVTAPGAGISPGDSITQDSVQAIDVSVRQTPVNLQTGAGAVEYNFRLSAAPRTQVAWGTGPGTSPIGPNPGGPPEGCSSASCLGPSLLVDGTNGVSTGGNSSVSVTGSAYVDGSMNCSNNTTFSATGGTYAVGTTSGCGPTSPTGFVQDPLASLLPACFPQQKTAGTLTSLGGNVFQYSPGDYPQTIPPTNTHGTFYFEPGVYELDGGLNVTNNQTIQVAPNNNGQGLLFYAPGPPPSKPVPGCAYSTSSPTFNLGAQGSATSLPPLTTAQATAAFGDPYVGGMTFWQDSSNSTGAKFGAGSTSSSTGLAYLPSSVVTLSGQGLLPFGILYCAGLVLVGGSNLQLAG
jgi:prepilin-type N-terminal cleavage/methylation domain-containing protein